MKTEDVNELAKAMYDRGIYIGQTLVYKWDLAPNPLKDKYREEANLILQEIIKLGYRKCTS